MLLDKSDALKNKLQGMLDHPNVYNIKSIEDLDGRRLQFRTHFRPRARYMWRAYLNSIVNLSFRHKSTRGIGVGREVELGNRYWGTRRRYVKRNQLLGFVEHLGHAIECISGSSILEHGIESGGEEEGPDTTVVVVVADTTIRKASSNLSRLGVVNDSDEEGDTSEEEWEKDWEEEECEETGKSSAT
ncbi:hypothetical protein F4805DRAFT_358629 [Annulohypoxylon moriforme]|nr:hypothetical protein F4805DRAFT_358629 [Annulohypoxylon moriforme]